MLLEQEGPRPCQSASLLEIEAKPSSGQSPHSWTREGACGGGDWVLRAALP